MPYLLSIDSSKGQQITISLQSEGMEKTKTVDATEDKSQSLLPTLESFLSEEGVVLEEIEHITISVGPGSFTGLRVGAAIASTLSLLLNIPINGNPPGIVPELEYGEDRWNLKRPT